MSLVKNKQTKIYTHEKKNFISSPFPESRLRLNRRIKACYCVFFNNCLHFYEMREYKKSVTILARLLCIVKCLFLAESFWYSLRIKTYFCPQLLQRQDEGLQVLRELGGSSKWAAPPDSPGASCWATLIWR